jgi:hypothetical protein
VTDPLADLDGMPDVVHDWYHSSGSEMSVAWTDDTEPPTWWMRAKPQPRPEETP